MSTPIIVPEWLQRYLPAPPVLASLTWPDLSPLSCSLPASPPPTPVAPARRFGDHLPRIPPELSKSLEYSEYTSPRFERDRGAAHFLRRDTAHFLQVYEWRCEEEDIKHEFGQKYCQDPPHPDRAASTPQFLKDNRRLKGYLACAHACLLIRSALLEAQKSAQAVTDAAVASLSNNNYLHSWLPDLPRWRVRRLGVLYTQECRGFVPDPTWGSTLAWTDTTWANDWASGVSGTWGAKEWGTGTWGEGVEIGAGTWTVLTRRRTGKQKRVRRGLRHMGRHRPFGECELILPAYLVGGRRYSRPQCHSYN
ncbi:hypothetical protein C8R45DRAFT_1113692 [Mycena sanguinolenta]|nr:hypothetical protein C8R45DRAFT_1113692 [Mycena sanguinolenta]